MEILLETHPWIVVANPARQAAVGLEEVIEHPRQPEKIGKIPNTLAEQLRHHQEQRTTYTTLADHRVQGANLNRG